MSEYTIHTFGDHILQFARTVGIVPPDMYSEIMTTIWHHLETELNAGFFSITIEKLQGNQPILEGEWPERERDWWAEPVKKDGEYTCQTALAHDIRKPLWIVGKNREKLNETKNYEDFLGNVTPSEIPQYARIQGIDAILTSIILPLTTGNGRHFGVMNVESKDYLIHMSTWERELRTLADAISILRQKKRTYQFQMDNTREAKLRLYRGEFVRVIRDPAMFFAYSSRADNEVVGVISQVLSEYEKGKYFRVVKWMDPMYGNIIDNIWNQISTCAFATCYFSEFTEHLKQGDNSRFRDNPNVLFEAGMLHALQRAKRSPLQGVLLVRETNPLTIPFDISTESTVFVARLADGGLNKEGFQSELHQTLRAIGKFQTR